MQQCLLASCQPQPGRDEVAAHAPPLSVGIDLSACAFRAASSLGQPIGESAAYRNQSAELSDEERRIVEEVRRNSSLPLRLLEGEVAGKKRLVILLGEAHVQNASSAKCGERARSLSFVRGLEGWRPESLIEKAAELVWMPYFLMIEKIHKVLPGAYLSNIRASKLEAETDGRIRNFRAEEGRKPDIVHGIGMLGVGSFITIVPAAYFATGIMQMVQDKNYNPFSEVNDSMARGTSVVLGMLWSIPLILLSQSKKFRFLERATNAMSVFMEVIFDACGLGRSREEAMRRKTLDEFEQDPSLSRVLLMTGRAHTLRLEERFIEKGFRPIA